MIAQSTIKAVLSRPYEGVLSGIDGVSIDTRTLKSGELYVAVRGERFDGHHFLQQAADAGAVAAMVDTPIEHAPLPLLLVDDTIKALGKMATLHRASMPAKVIAITGSCGKTTTRALTASIFSLAGNTLASVGSLNNNIGVPLTLLKLTPNHQYAIQEIGTNNPGEIAELTAIANPDVSVVTLAAPVHLEGLKTIEGVAREKGAIFTGLKPDGTAVMNADDPFLNLWQHMAGSRQQIRFALNNSADVRADNVRTQDGYLTFRLITPVGECEIALQFLGKHNVTNALAAAGMAIAAGIDLTTIQQGLQQARPENRRLIAKDGVAGCQVIDDSYNANPVAMGAAIELLASFDKRRILVFGDMAELGDQAMAYHQQVGELAKQHHIDALYCYGDLSKYTADCFGEHGYHFADKAALIDSLKRELDESALVLVKGSNGMQMNDVTRAIIKEV